MRHCCCCCGCGCCDSVGGCWNPAWQFKYLTWDSSLSDLHRVGGGKKGREEGYTRGNLYYANEGSQLMIDAVTNVSFNRGILNNREFIIAKSIMLNLLPYANQEEHTGRRNDGMQMRRKLQWELVIDKFLAERQKWRRCGVAGKNIKSNWAA